MPLDYQKLIDRPFAPFTRRYGPADCIRFAQGFGAGVDPAWAEADHPFLQEGPDLQALPMAAVALADGEFWPMDPDTGIAWQQIIHAAETLTLHRPLPTAGSLTVTQRIDEIFDRGAERGAELVQVLHLHDEHGNAAASIEVSMILRGNGGFGGRANDRPRPAPLPQRPADEVLLIKTPTADDTPFRLSAEISVAAENPQPMIRGLGCFGLAGRGVLKLLCGNQPAKLRSLGVRYAGPMFVGETMRLEVWKQEPGHAVFRMHAVERDVPVLGYGSASFD